MACQGRAVADYEVGESQPLPAKAEAMTCVGGRVQVPAERQLCPSWLFANERNTMSWAGFPSPVRTCEIDGRQSGRQEDGDVD